MSIPFTQYKMPDGRKVPVGIERPKEVEAMARWLIERGHAFEIEMLQTGEVSMSVENPDTGAILAHELCNNGPDVPVCVDRITKEARDKVYAEH